MVNTSQKTFRAFKGPYGGTMFALFICALAVISRFIGLFGNPWLDEIWSFVVVSRMDSPLRIFTVFTDNNHILNSLFMYLVGNHDPSDFYKYRLLSFFCGMGTVLITYSLVKRLFSERLTSCLAALLVAASFPLVVYSSEARGYGPGIFFAVLSLFALHTYLERKSMPMLLCFNLSVILGFLSHMTFLWVAAGLLVYFLCFMIRRSASFKAITLLFLKCFLIPVLIISVVYAPFASKMVYNGGPEFTYLTILNQAASFLAGYPEAIPLSYPMAVMAYALLAAEVYFLVRKSEPFGFLCAAMILVPIVYLSVSRPIYVSLRYFVCLYPFLLILLAHLFARLFFGSPARKVCSVVLIVLVVAGNTAHTANFLVYGRGGYAEAVRYIRENSSSNPITIASDSDFRNRLLIDFYGRMNPAGASLVYIPSSYARVFTSGPDWFIIHRYERTPDYPQSFKVGGVVDYELKRWFPYSGELSGFHWFLYRRR